MNLESQQESKGDIMNERFKRGGLDEVKKVEQENTLEKESKPLENTKEIAMKRADRIMAESEKIKNDAEGIKEIQEKLGVDLSESIQKKENEVEALSAGTEVVDEEESDLDYAKRDVKEYMEHDIVSKHLSPEEIKKFNQEFSEEVSSLTDPESIENATSQKIEEINRFINEKRGREKENKIVGSVDEVEKPETSDRIKNFAERIKLANSPNELLSLVDNIDGLEGSEVSFTSEELAKRLTKYFSSGDKKDFEAITRTAGLRNNAKRVFDNMKKLQEKYKNTA